jgi:Fur family transcriptional regulator, ferric uptake regulator
MIASVPTHGDGWAAHAATVLRDAGVRAGPGRAAVTQVLADGGCLMSARDILTRLGHDASLSTVYRTLDLLHEHRLLRRVDAGEGIARYEPVDPSGDDAHQHVVFEDGGVMPFTDPELAGAMAGLGQRLGLEIEAHELIVHARRVP